MCFPSARTTGAAQWPRALVWTLAVALIVALLPARAARAQGMEQFDLHGPPGSIAFGTHIVALPNGNFLVTDPQFEQGETKRLGAVYLYSGTTFEVISTLTGSMKEDRVGSGGVTVLANGNFVVVSPGWHVEAGVFGQTGAVTWGSAVSGFGAITATVSVTNSLTGASIGYPGHGAGVYALPNGNYVVNNPYRDNYTGAVTWGDGNGGTVGVVSESNSLLSSTREIGRITVLPNGDYVVASPWWNEQRGAVTWANGNGGTVGQVSAANSLLGSNSIQEVQGPDEVGGGGIVVLANGNYVVNSTGWGMGGAVTWGDGAAGTAGVVSAANSLVAAFPRDYVGWRVTALTNGHYVVNSREWQGGRGAATWANGWGGTVGPVTPDNSLVGAQRGDTVGAEGIFPLANGNYVVVSGFWNDERGAVTWGNGSGGTVGPVSATNSLVGREAYEGVGQAGMDACLVVLTNGHYAVCGNGVVWGDGNGGTVGFVTAENSLQPAPEAGFIGTRLVPLANGNYVVVSLSFARERGAVTWVDGSGPAVGTVGAANSLILSAEPEYNLDLAVQPLQNGNYLVVNPAWDNGALEDAGAVTWGSGVGPLVGQVSAANSLVGTHAFDQVGRQGVLRLADGNYVVNSALWDRGDVVDAGAVTWGSGAQGIAGPVAEANSLVGNWENMQLGGWKTLALADGSYVVHTHPWSDEITPVLGAATWSRPGAPLVGRPDRANSVVGGAPWGGPSFVFAFAEGPDSLLVGRPIENIVTGVSYHFNRMILNLVTRLEE